MKWQWIENCDLTDSSEEESAVQPKPQESVEDDIDSDSGVEGTMEEDIPEEPSEGGEITTVQLLAARRDRLAHEKLRIGALCSSLLESPEKKVILRVSFMLLTFIVSYFLCARV